MQGWIIFFLGLILGIPLSIFANIATPSVMSYFKNRSLSTKQRKTKFIVDDYKRTKQRKENPLILQNATFEMLSAPILAIGVFISLFGLASVLDNFLSPTIGIFIRLLTIFFFSFTMRFFSQASRNIIRNTGNFERYEKDTIKQLEKLGYSTAEATEVLKK